MTVAPSETDDEKLLYIGKAAHISEQLRADQDMIRVLPKSKEVQ